MSCLFSILYWLILKLIHNTPVGIWRSVPQDPFFFLGVSELESSSDVVTLEFRAGAFNNIINFCIQLDVDSLISIETDSFSWIKNFLKDS